MQLSIQMSLNATAEIAALDSYGPMVRVFYVAGSGQDQPQADVGASVPWSRASSASMGQDSWGGFSGQCWYTGRSLLEMLGGAIPIGLVESSVGGTAIRDWSPTSALAMCPQPYNSPNPYGEGPYEHSELYNGMINGFGTGPTSFKAVLWNQAESDSYPQTPLEYYGCQTIAQINSWRTLLNSPSLPWVFVHLQPYTGSGPCCLENLRSSQTAALMLPGVGYATAIDLGDPTSPYGNVHFQNKQVSGRRAAQALLSVAYGQAAAAAPYPPPRFLSQTAFFNNSTKVATMRVVLAGGAAPLVILPNSSVSCLGFSPCTDFEVLGSDGNSYAATAWAIDSTTGELVLSALMPSAGGIYGVGSAYAWSMWPRVLLYSGGSGGFNDSASLPVLPWRQALSIGAMPGPPPVRVRLHHISGKCLSTNSSSAFPCVGGWTNSCPVFLDDCSLQSSVWGEDPVSGQIANLGIIPKGSGYVNIDCDQCSAGRVAKLMSSAGSNGGLFPAFDAASGTLQMRGGCAGMCLNDGTPMPAVPTCEPGEAVVARQAQLAKCSDESAQGWTRELVL